MSTDEPRGAMMEWPDELQRLVGAPPAFVVGGGSSGRRNVVHSRTDCQMLNQGSTVHKLSHPATLPLRPQVCTNCCSGGTTRTTDDHEVEVIDA